MVSIFIAEKKHAPTTSLNKRVSGSGFQPSPKSPSTTSDTRRDVICNWFTTENGVVKIWR